MRSARHPAPFAASFSPRRMATGNPGRIGRHTREKRFERVCNDTAHNLIVRSLGGPHEIARESLREIGMVADAYTVLAIQKPLP